ncbi:MAG: hypothetical protein RLZ98_531 [Pseudomonadota bacterium]
MSIHLVKLSAGTDSVESLAEWQAERLAMMKQDGLEPELFHRTLQMPRRREELLDGGSIYWVIKGMIQARQRLMDFREGTRLDGTPCTLLILDRQLVPVRPVPRRAFQGWRYLAADDAPPDLGVAGGEGLEGMPPRLRRALAELCLL